LHENVDDELLSLREGPGEGMSYPTRSVSMFPRPVEA